ncbi:MAG: hypothetical protein BGO95_01890 [Micrococcales bacterium 73-13]|nr:MAG: hypothetical protein BGO95_01890 [Micrococcales bacterium 73-13]
MSEFIKQNTEATEQYMAFLAKTQEQILESARQIPVAKAPAFPGKVEVPSAVAEVPTPRELTLAAFSFTEKLIAQQRSFMEQYLDIAESKAKESTSDARKKS